MAGRLSRWYAAALGVGLLYLTAWVFMAGFGGAVIQVDFNVYPELEGTVVAIDGDSAGVLFGRGRQRLSGFRVKLGEHTVTLRHDSLPSDTARVSATLRGTQHVVYAYPEGERRDGVYRRYVGLGPRLPD